MKYEAQLATDVVVGRVLVSRHLVDDGPWEVVEVTPDGKRLYMASGSEAQMKIYAWSLSRVSEGCRLQASPFVDEITGFVDGKAQYVPVEYDGPTDDV